MNNILGAIQMSSAALQRRTARSEELWLAGGQCGLIRLRGSWGFTVTQGTMNHTSSRNADHWMGMGGQICKKSFGFPHQFPIHS